MATVTVNLPSGKNWKTTMFGAITAAGAGMVLSEDPTIVIIGKILTILGPVLFGLFAKDNNVTGGSVVQPSTQAAKAAVTDSPAPPAL